MCEIQMFCLLFLDCSGVAYFVLLMKKKADVIVDEA